MIGRRRFLGLGGAGAIGAIGGFETRRRTESMRLHYDDVENRANAAPGSVSRLGQGRIVWSVDTDRPVVALTFDDGPDPDFTPAVLDALDEVGATATFFVMGHNVEQHPVLFRRVVEAGHEIGCHTSEHLDLAMLDPVATTEQVVNGLEMIGTDVPVSWFRPPRGNITGATPAAVAAARLDVAMWSVEARVRGGESRDALTSRVVSTVGAGDIVLFHDGIGRGTFFPEEDFARRIHDRRRREIDALPDILAGLVSNGVEFVSLGDLVMSTEGMP